jgi:hypothetical protein
MAKKPIKQIGFSQSGTDSKMKRVVDFYFLNRSYV